MLYVDFQKEKEKKQAGKSFSNYDLANMLIVECLQLTIFARIF